MTSPQIPRIWTLTDERAGNFNQAQALALAMGAVERHVALRFPPPWRWLAPRGVIGALQHLALPTDVQRPDIVIGCGRQAGLALRALKRSSGTFTVQILDPRCDAQAFDLVVTPAHDLLKGENVLSTIGALNAVGPDWLKQARSSFAELASLPRPLTSLLIGGPHREAPLNQPALEALLGHLASQAKASDGSLLVCGSRRTPMEWRPMLRARALELGARVWMDEHDGANPYRGYLAQADRLIVTSDSVNMLSEACAVGVAVMSFSANELSGKIARFHAALRQAQLLSTLDEPTVPPTPLRETAGVADRVLHHWRDSVVRRGSISESVSSK